MLNKHRDGLVTILGVKYPSHVKDIEKTTIEAKVTMKHFEEAVKKVREQKDLKMGEKLVASYYR